MRGCIRIDSEQAATRAAVTATFAVVAEATGVTVDALRPRQGRRLNDPELSEVRRRAIYLAVVAYGRGQRGVGRVIGLSHTEVSRACRRVEDDRDDAVLDSWLDQMERRLVA